MDDRAEITQVMLGKLRERAPEFVDFMRRLYNAGLIPGTRTLNSVQVHGEERIGAPPTEGVLISPPWNPPQSRNGPPVNGGDF